MNVPDRPPHGRHQIAGLLVRILGIIVACMAAAGCATDALDRAPASPLEPWRPRPLETQSDTAGNDAAAASLDGYAVGADPRIAKLHQGPTLDSDTAYSLP